MRKVNEKVLFLIKLGIPAEVIANQYGISKYTVYYYRKKLKKENKLVFPQLNKPVANLVAKILD